MLLHLKRLLHPSLPPSHCYWHTEEMNGEAMDPAQEQQQNAGNTSHLPPPPTITPAIPPYVKLGLTIAYTVFYSLLFAFVYAQLWLVLRYRHKRFSYQTAFLFLCLLWAALRALLFSFYFRDCVTANALGPFAFWLLYCFPVCLQFFTLSLMNLYCAQVSGLLLLLLFCCCYCHSRDRWLWERLTGFRLWQALVHAGSAGLICNKSEVSFHLLLMCCHLWPLTVRTLMIK